MYEVELKVRVEHDAVRERLIDLGAEPLGTSRQVDTYYEAPHREFAETDEALRLRREERDADRTTKLTYKGPLVDPDSKTREELETGVDDAKSIDAILERLGFEAAATVEKTRERFEYDEYTVVLDDVSGLGEFLEIEAEAEAIEPAREGAIRLLSDLGLDPDEQIRTSYLGMLLDSDPPSDAPQ